MIVEDLGTLAYSAAYARQEQAHERILAGEEERLLMVEHPAVITFGRRAGQEAHVLAAAPHLAQMGVEVINSDRGGDVTFHGPGQLVAYPVIRLIDHQISVGGYVQRLEDAVIDALRSMGVESRKDPSAIGIWVTRQGVLAKICALGVRVRKGVTMHGIALNVTTDLRYFNLIVPCGLSGRPVTSLQELMGKKCPPMAEVKRRFVRAFGDRFGLSWTKE